MNDVMTKNDMKDRRPSLPDLGAHLATLHARESLKTADILPLPLAMARQLKGKARKQTKEEKRAASARRLKAKEDFVNFYLPLISALLVGLLVLFFYYY